MGSQAEFPIIDASNVVDLRELQLQNLTPIQLEWLVRLVDEAPALLRLAARQQEIEQAVDRVAEVVVRCPVAAHIIASR